MGGKKPLLDTPSSLTAVPYPALPPHPFLRLVLRLFEDSTLLSFVWTVPLQSPHLYTYTQPGPNLYLYKSCKYVKFYPCALSLLSQPQTRPQIPFPPLLFGCCNYLGFVLYISGVCVCGLGGNPSVQSFLAPSPMLPSPPTTLRVGRCSSYLFYFVFSFSLSTQAHSQPSLPHHCPFFSTPSPISFFSGVCGETEKSCLINRDCSFIAMLTFLGWDLQKDRQGNRIC